MKQGSFYADGEFLSRAGRTEGFFERFRGLMGVSPIEKGLYIIPCGDIHTFFMKEAIDVAFLDGEGNVLKVMEAMAPGKLSGAVKGAKAVAELPAGTLRGKKPGRILWESER